MKRLTTRCSALMLFGFKGKVAESKIAPSLDGALTGFNSKIIPHFFLITLRLAMMFAALSVFLTLGLSGGALAADPDLEQAEALMKAGKPAEAYTLLEPFAFEQSGNLRFDYLLGISALDSGKPDKATLAFERVLAVDPNFAGARLDMARAYFQLGDYARAKTEFQTVLTQNPPEMAKATVQKYLALIEVQQKPSRNAFNGYLEFGRGHDSNVNSATSQAQITVPALFNLTFTLNPSNVRSSDNYLGINGGGEFIHHFKPGLGAYAGGEVRYRRNDNQSQFNFTDSAGRVGAIVGDGADVLRVGLIGGRYLLADRTNRDTNGGSLDWRHTFNPSNQLNVFGQYARYRFADPALTTENFDQYTYGEGLIHVFLDGKAVANASFFTGEEFDTDNRADGGKRFYGARLGGQGALADKLELFVSVGAQRGVYGKENIAFQVFRRDNLYDATAGLIWHIVGAWSVRPQVLYIKNTSNETIHRYERTDISLFLRRDFNF